MHQRSVLAEGRRFHMEFSNFKQPQIDKRTSSSPWLGQREDVLLLNAVRNVSLELRRAQQGVCNRDWKPAWCWRWWLGVHPSSWSEFGTMNLQLDKTKHFVCILGCFFNYYYFWWAGAIFGLILPFRINKFSCLEKVGAEYFYTISIFWKQVSIQK